MFRELIHWVRNDMLEMVRAPSAEVLALRELEDAKRRMLEAQSAKEYAASMCKYHEDRIKRLSAYLRDAHQEVA